MKEVVETAMEGRRHTQTVAHELINQLSAILGFCEIAIGELEPKHPACEQVLLVKDRVLKSAHFVRQILVLGRKESFEPKVLNLNDFFSKIEDMLRVLLGKSIDLKLALCSEPAHVELDPQQFERSILNLLSNSKDAMPSGGELIIQTEHIRSNNGILVDPEVASIKVSVRDTGIGMDATTLSNAFDPFFTTKDPGIGTGLGLADVKEIIRHIGGRISVVSNVGDGTTFVIYLPQASLPKM